MEIGGGKPDLEVDMVQDLQESPAQLITLQEASWDVLRKLQHHAEPTVNYSVRHMRHVGE